MVSSEDNLVSKVLEEEKRVSIDQDKPLVTEETGESLEPTGTVKKKYLEPEISQPVDVLEATTFFQVTESGATN